MATRAGLSAAKTRTVGRKKKTIQVKQEKPSNVEIGYMLFVGTQTEFFISKIEVGNVSKESAVIRRNCLSKGQLAGD